MSTSASVDTVERLALVRYQLRQARTQLDAPYPLSGLSINYIQDAIESLLNVIAENLVTGSTKPTTEFAVLLDRVLDGLSEPDKKLIASFRPRLLNMNKARVESKHHGTIPEKAVIARYLDQSEQFASLLVESVLQLSLEEVSLNAFVKSESGRQHLGTAHEKWDQGDEEGARGYLSMAFDHIVEDYRNRKWRSRNESFYRTSPFPKPKATDLDRKSELRPYAQWLERIDDWMRVLVLGIDMQEYAFFRAHTPTIAYRLQGAPYAGNGALPAFGPYEFNRCYEFVLRTALDLGQRDFDVDLWRETRVRDHWHGPTLPLEY